MADLEKQKQDELVQKLIQDTLKQVDTDKINPEAKDSIKSFNPDLIGENKLPTTELKNYVRSLPTKEKDKVLRYIDIFRNDITPVVEYINDIRKYGTEKEAKKQGATSGLLNPNKYLKEFSKTGDEEDLERLTINLIQGDFPYDVTIRNDIVGQQRKKEYMSKKTTKAMRGVGIAMEESARNATRTVAAMVDLGFDTDMLSYLENRWPEVEKSRQGIEQLSEDLTQFGISVVAGKKILKGFGSLAKKFAPNTTRKIVEKLQKPKTIKDKVGNIKGTSSVAQKMAYWGVPTTIGYGIGEFITGADKNDRTLLGDTFGLAETLKLKSTEGLSGREKAAETLKNKLKYGADGTALVGGLTIAGKTVLTPTLKATSKYILAPTFRQIGDKILNPISQIAASEKTGIPQLFRGIQNTTQKVMTKAGIPSMDKWGMFSTTSGPLKERLMKAADKFILTPIRTRGPLTKEAKDLLNDSQNLVRKYQKRVDLSLKNLESKVYQLAEIGFTDRVFTNSTKVAGKQYLDDVLQFLQGKITDKQLPQALQGPAKEVRAVIDNLTKELKPYIKSGELEKEFVDNIGKYLRNSYEIFRSNSYKPSRETINKAIEFFKDGLKKTKSEYKDVKIGSGSALEKQLTREASSKVDEILQVGQEGTSPKKRIEVISSITTPISNLIEKQSIPKVIQQLLGKVDDPRAIVLDTVTQQANLLAHLQVHKRLLENGLKNNWIFKSQEDFIKRKFQEETATSLVPIRVSKNPMNVDLTDIYTYKAGKNRVPYLTTREMASALNGDTLITDFLLKIPLYKSYLAAKTASQLSKTVLSLMTQMRNVETAAFFSFINGHMGRNASVIDAMKIAFQDVIGKGPVKPEVMRKKLEEYLQYGVFDNSVVAGEVEAVMKDIVSNRFSTSEQFMKYLLNNPVFRKATEFYQASDNLWKAYGYEFTKSQLVPAIPIKGLSVKEAVNLGYKVPKGRTQSYSWQELIEQQYKEVFNKKWDRIGLNGEAKTYAESMREVAARYIRDVYPNYSMVPSIVQNWRRLPLGNFVAFQSEIIRNLYNILTYSTREMASSNPYIRQMGARRFLGFGSVVYGFDKGIQGVSQSLTGIDEDFIKGYQRFFSPWYAKNDTIIPVSKIDPKTKKFTTIDWSKEQPFASATDALRTFGDAVFSPNKSDEAMFTRFFKSMFYDYDEKKNGALTKLFEPFITESILTEAILDVSPTWMPVPGARGGKTREGQIIYDPVNDDKGVIAAKIFNHLIQTINPTTFKNAGQVLAAYDNEVSKAGQKYNTTNEILKLFLGIGLREEDPNTSFTYIISDFSERIRNADSTFKRKAFDLNEIYKNPRQILELFEDLQKNRYREMSRVKDFLNVAEQIYTRQEINLNFKDRQNFGKDTMRYLFADKYRASNLPSYKEYTSLLQKSYRKLQDTYPGVTFKELFPLDQLNAIKQKWNGTPLGLSDEEVDKFHRERYGLKDERGEIPVEEVIKTASIKPKIQTPPLPQTPQPVISDIQTAQINPQTGLTRTEQALLSPSEQSIRQQQRS